jgi:pyridoxal 5'-phosphate synthase pdxT subunit
VLAKYDNLPVLLQEQHIMVATFHPELTNDTTICDYFIHNVG